MVVEPPGKHSPAGRRYIIFHVIYNKVYDTLINISLLNLRILASKAMAIEIKGVATSLWTAIAVHCSVVKFLRCPPSLFAQGCWQKIWVSSPTVQLASFLAGICSSVPKLSAIHSASFEGSHRRTGRAVRYWMATHSGATSFSQCRSPWSARGTAKCLSAFKRLMSNDSLLIW